MRDYRRKSLPDISQVRGIKGAWKKVQRAFALGFAFEIRENHGNIAAKFPDDLAARATGRRERVGIGDDGDGFEIVLALGDGFENGDAFGAEREAVAGVFDVAAAIDASGFGMNGGAHEKFGERRVRVFAGGARGGDELVFVNHNSG